MLTKPVTARAITAANGGCVLCGLG